MTAIPQTMQAVVMHAPEDYRLEERPVPAPAADELLIKVEAVGVCASDLKAYAGAAKFWGDENRDRWVEPGIIPGHEITGEVVSGSEEALAHHGVSVGDRIVVEQIVPCGECMYCQRGWYWMCDPHDMFGFKQYRRHGRLHDRALAGPRPPISRTSPRSTPPRRAASCSLHAVERAELTFDDAVVVAGAADRPRPIIGAAHKNPKLVIALDFDDDKLELAKKCGADLTLNPSKVDIYEEIRGLTGGYGADVYIECTGHPSAVPQGLNLLRKLGRFVEYSVFKENVSVDWSIISDDKEPTARTRPAHRPAAIKIIEKGDPARRSAPQFALMTQRPLTRSPTRRRLRQGLHPPFGLLIPSRRPTPRVVGRPVSLPHAHRSALMSAVPSTTQAGSAVPAAGSSQETFLDRLGIPHPLRWGFLGVLVFMTGNGVETNFVSPHMANVFGGGDEMINVAATIITFYSLASLVGSYLAVALSDLWGRAG